jgi:hypothetical protein
MQHRSFFAIPLGELKFKFAKGGKIKKSFNHPRSLYSTRPIQQNHFQADLMWCDSTFKNNYYLVRHLVVVTEAWTAGMSLDRKLATTKNKISLGFL